ncbi:hypothetical protein DMUE_2003 [Dictyocoela muelleri]|nr:hypothetical protein DMUE_2003 [Dictyocoela muelleri]
MNNIINNTERINSLKTKITKLKNSGLLKNRKKIILPDIQYFKPIKTKRGLKIKAYELDIIGTDISAINNYFLVYNDKINIYKWTDKIKLVKKIDSHLIVFLLKSGRIDKIKNVLFNILLTVYSQDIERFESVLENVILFLEIVNVSDMKIENDFLVVDRVGERVVYNQKLQFIDFLVNFNDTKCDSNLYLSFCSLKIVQPDKSFDEEIYLGEYRQIFFIENYALVLMKDKMMILSFET